MTMVLTARCNLHTEALGIGDDTPEPYHEALGVTCLDDADVALARHGYARHNEEWHEEYPGEFIACVSEVAS